MYRAKRPGHPDSESRQGLITAVYNSIVMWNDGLEVYSAACEAGGVVLGATSEDSCAAQLERAGQWARMRPTSKLEMVSSTRPTSSRPEWEGRQQVITLASMTSTCTPTTPAQDPSAVTASHTPLRNRADSVRAQRITV